MGLFALADFGLSTYVWLVTFWDLYRPLSSTIASNTPAINIWSLFNLATSFCKGDVQTPSRSRRSQVRLENAQREQIRTSLRALLIWLMIKGSEPLFDNSLGYIVPFYGLSKAIILSFFVCFRVELCKQLFESFVVPLGKPNAPLLNLGSLSTVVLPTVRFLLSLPLAHLIVAIKGRLAPFIETNQVSPNQRKLVSSEESITDSQTYSRRIPSDRVPPPPSPASSRSVSGASNRRRGAGGGGRDGLGESRRRKEDSLLAAHEHYSTKSMSSTTSSIHPRSTSIGKNSYSILQDLPPAPQQIPSVSTALSASESHPSINSLPESGLRSFAFIPSTTPPQAKSAIGELHPVRSSGSVNSSDAFSSRVPGFLVSQEGVTVGMQRVILGKEDEDVLQKIQVLKSNGINGDGSNTIEATKGSTKSKLTNGSIRRKRMSDDESEPSFRKTRITPSRGRKEMTASVPLKSDSIPEGRINKSTLTGSRLSAASKSPQETNFKPRSRTRKRDV